MGGTEQQYVKEAFDTNWVAPLGRNVDLFERSIADFLGSNTKVAALSSGTSALHLGLILLGVEPDDDVICQSFTFSASCNPILYLGANPIFVDSERETWNMSPVLLEEVIIERLKTDKKPKAIVAVHLYGMPYNHEAIKEISNKYDIPVLEDSAEALGSSYKHEPCGALGDISILSFNGNKIITTSGGGALVSKSKSIRDRSVFLATQARDDAPHYQHSNVGYNYRMSNVLAGIGRGQMEVLEDRVLARRANFDFYVKELNEISEIEFLNEPEHLYSNRWLSCILTPSLDIREQIRQRLLAESIESRPLWKPMHEQPIFRDYLAKIDGTSLELFERGLCLPSGSNLIQEDLNRIVQIVKNSLI